MKTVRVIPITREQDLTGERRRKESAAMVGRDWERGEAPMHFEEIGRRLGMSRGNVYLLHNAAIGKIRDAVVDEIRTRVAKGEASVFERRWLQAVEANA